MPVTRDQVHRATELSARIYRLTAERALEPDAREEAELLRKQAFIALLESYEEAHAGVQLIRRREKDIDALMPSLYSERGGRGKKKQENAQEPAPEVVAEPAVADAEEVRPTTAADGPIGNMPRSPFIA